MVTAVATNVAAVAVARVVVVVADEFSFLLLPLLKCRTVRRRLLRDRSTTRSCWTIGGVGCGGGGDGSSNLLLSSDDVNVDADGSVNDDGDNDGDTLSGSGKCELVRVALSSGTAFVGIP